MANVYVSSTYEDLKECRAAVRLALQRLQQHEVAMETYIAEPDRPVEKCLKDIAECDLYVGIFAWRYGHIPLGYDQSITELEYRNAIHHGKPCLIFLLHGDAPWPQRYVDKGQDAVRIIGLRNEMAQRHMCSFFFNAQELATLMTAAVAKLLWTQKPPADSAPNPGKLDVPISLRRSRRLPHIEGVGSWHVEVMNKSARSLTFRVYLTSEDHILSLRAGGVDSIWVDGKVLMQRDALFGASRTFELTDGGQMRRATLVPLSGIVPELLQGFLTGASLGGYARIGPVRFIVDGRVLFES